MIETDYELFAVVIHKGTCYSGHYYGYIKDVDHIGCWTRPAPPPSPAVRYLQCKALLRDIRIYFELLKVFLRVFCILILINNGAGQL